jgi:hypothetical protein
MPIKRARERPTTRDRAARKPFGRDEGPRVDVRRLDAVIAYSSDAGSTDSGGGRPGQCRMHVDDSRRIDTKERSSVALSIHCHRQSTLAGKRSRFGFQTTGRWLVEVAMATGTWKIQSVFRFRVEPFLLWFGARNRPKRVELCAEQASSSFVQGSQEGA